LIFLLIPLEILWVNLHINFLIGIILIFLFVLDDLFSNKLRINLKTKTLFWVFLLTAASAIVNPNGIKGALFPLTFYQNFAFPVEENQNFFTLGSIFNYATLLPLEIPIFILFLLLLIQRKKSDLIDYLLFIVFGGLIFIAVRNISLFAYATFFTFAKLFSPTLKFFVIKLKKIILENKYFVLKTFGMLMLCLLLIVNIIRSVSLNGFGLGINDNGKNALDFFVKNDLKGPIYNDFDFGEYIAYRLYPEEKVFVDARPEAYPKEFFENVYIPMSQDVSTFLKFSNLYKFNSIILSTWNSPISKNKFLSYLINDKKSGFALVYFDDYAVILVRKNSSNRYLIRKLSVDKNNFNPNSISDIKKLTMYIFFFEKVGWKNQEIKTYNRLKILDPSNCSLKASLYVFSPKYAKLRYINPDLSKKCI